MRSCDSGLSGVCEQDPDWLLHMAVYDENLLKNPFFVALEKQRPDLCSRVAEVHGVVSLGRWSRTLPSRGTPWCEPLCVRVCGCVCAGSGSVLQQLGGQQLPGLPV